MCQRRDGIIQLWDLNLSLSSVLSSFNFFTHHRGGGGGGIGGGIGGHSFHSTFCRCSLLRRCPSSLGPPLLLAPPTADSQELQVIDLQTTKCIQLLSIKTHSSLGLDSSTTTGMCMCLDLFSHPTDSNHIFACAGFENGTLYWWDLRNPSQHISNYQAHTEPILSMDGAFIGDGLRTPLLRRVITGSADRFIRITDWDMMSLGHEGESPHRTSTTLELQHPGISDVQVRRPDTRIFATAGWDHRVRIWDFKQKKPLAILKTHSQSVCCMDFTHNATSSNFTNTQSSTVPSEETEEDDYDELAHSMDAYQYLLASGSKDRRIALWSIYQPTQPA